MILRVGLTGGIASGKSSVARMLAERGCIVVDADDIVRELYEKKADGYRALVATWGNRILDSRGEVDRPALSRVALSTPEGAAKLNSLIHPLVIARQADLMNEIESRDRDAIVVVEATLLLESGGMDRYDRIVVVDLDPDTQLRRAVERGMPPEEVDRRRSRQMSREERVSKADYVIDNNGNSSELASRVEKLHDRLRADLLSLSGKA